MTSELDHDPADEPDAVRSADEQIRREALRQIDSIDLDNDEWRIAPLPPFEGEPIDAERLEREEVTGGRRRRRRRPRTGSGRRPRY